MRAGMWSLLIGLHVPEDLLWIPVICHKHGIFIPFRVETLDLDAKTKFTFSEPAFSLKQSLCQMATQIQFPEHVVNSIEAFWQGLAKLPLDARMASQKDMNSRQASRSMW